MIPRALNAPLSWIGLMRVSEHERIVAENDDQAYNAWSKMTNERDDMSASRTDMMHNIAKMQVENNQLNERLSSLYAAHNWQAQGYKTREEEINDMADVGRSLMDRLKSVLEKGGEMEGWTPMDDPAEIVSDMANVIYEQRVEIAELTPDALLWRAARLKRRGNK